MFGFYGIFALKLLGNMMTSLLVAVGTIVLLRHQDTLLWRHTNNDVKSFFLLW